MTDHERQLYARMSALCGTEAASKLSLVAVGCSERIDVCAECIEKPMSEVLRVMRERGEHQRKLEEKQYQHQQAAGMRPQGRLG